MEVDIIDPFTYSKSKAATNLVEELNSTNYRTKHKLSALLHGLQTRLNVIRDLSNNEFRHWAISHWRADMKVLLDTAPYLNERLISLAKNVMVGHYRNVLRIWGAQKPLTRQQRRLQSP